MPINLKPQGGPRIKPGLGAFINASHPLASRLVGVWLFNEGGGSVANNLINPSDQLSFVDLSTVPNPPIWDAIPNIGLGVRTPYNTSTGTLSGSPSTQLTTPSSMLKPTDFVTIFWCGSLGGPVAGGTTAGNQSGGNNPLLAGMTYTSTNSSPFIAYAILRSSSSQDTLRYAHDVGGSFASIDVNVSLTTLYGRDMSAGFSVKSGSQVAYFNGLNVGSGSASGSLSYSSPNFLTNTDLGASHSNVENAFSNILACYVFHGFLGAAEHQMLHAAPFSLFFNDNRQSSFAKATVQTFSYSGTGGVVLAGTAPKAQGHVYPTPTGGVTLAGTAPKAQGHVYPTPTGGVTLGGSAGVNVLNTYIGSGGIALAGTAPKAQGHAYPAANSGITLAGTAPRSGPQSYTGTGGITLAGTAPKAQGHTYPTPTGGVVLGGVSPTFPPSHLYTGSGGITLAGTAPKKQGHAYLPSGGVTFAGAAPHSGPFNYRGFGGVALGGHSPSAGPFVWIGTGGVVAGGTAPKSSGKVYPATTGGIVLGGTSPSILPTTLLEIYSNLSETTVATGGYTVGSGVLNVASTALPFKQTGSFRVAISDPVTAVVKVLLRVIGVFSSTQFLVVTEGTDAAALNLDIVTAILTEGAEDAIRSDNNRTDVTANLPSTALSRKGHQFNSEDGYRWWFNGTSWVPLGWSMMLAKPAVADFTTVNAGSSSLMDAGDGVVLRDVAAEGQLHLAEKALPTAPFTITAKLYGLTEIASGERPTYGLYFRDSSGGGITAISISNNNGGSLDPALWIGADTYASYSASAASLVSPVRFAAITNGVWARLHDDNAGNRSLYYSFDGINWETLYSGSITATKVGFYLGTTGSARILSILLNSWLVS